MIANSILTTVNEKLSICIVTIRLNIHSKIFTYNRGTIYNSSFLYLPRQDLGNGTTAGHGTCPKISHMQCFSHMYPKLAGLSFFSFALASMSSISLFFPSTFKTCSWIRSLSRLSTSINKSLPSFMKHLIKSHNYVNVNGFWILVEIKAHTLWMESVSCSWVWGPVRLGFWIESVVGAKIQNLGCRCGCRPTYCSGRKIFLFGLWAQSYRLLSIVWFFVPELRLSWTAWLKRIFLLADSTTMIINFRKSTQS